MKLLIYGVGQFYQERREQLRRALGKDELVGFLDRRADALGSVDGLPVYPVEKAMQITHDRVIVMSAAKADMLAALLQSGVPREEISFWQEWYCPSVRGVREEHPWGRSSGRKRVLVLTQDLGLHGGAMAALYAAEVLQARGFETWLCAPTAKRAFLKEAQGRGVNVAVIPSIPYPGKSEYDWIGCFDIAVINVFPMLKSACEISRILPTLWWIHEGEADFLYRNTMAEFSSFRLPSCLRFVYVAAVSPVAQMAFERICRRSVDQTLLLAIPDACQKASAQRAGKRAVCFAVIGAICQNKGQDLLIEAVRQLAGLPFRVLLIGDAAGDFLPDEIPDQVHLCGQYTREEMREAFEQDIDVVVCTSREETVSIATVEGLMYGKVCIVSDAAGVAACLTDGEDAFLFRSGDAGALADCMRRVITEWNEMDAMRVKARRKYEEVFAMERFGARLETALDRADVHWVKTKGFGGGTLDAGLSFGILDGAAA